MKFKWWTVAGLLLLGLSVFLWRCNQPVAQYRYRMTVEINTPHGVKSGSAVHAVRWDYYGGAITSFIGKMQGEAVFVDLGADQNGKPRHVIALLPSERMVPDVLGYRESQRYGEYQAITGVHAVGVAHMPDLVTFADLSDPTTAKLIYKTGARHSGGVPVDEFASVFGPGFSMHRITVEIQPATEPITRGIEGRLPVAMAKLREEAKISRLARPSQHR